VGQDSGNPVDGAISDLSISEALAGGVGSVLFGLVLVLLLLRPFRRAFPEPLAPGIHPQGWLLLGAAAVFGLTSVLAYSLFPGERGSDSDSPDPIHALRLTAVAGAATLLYLGFALRRRGGQLSDLGLRREGALPALSLAALFFVACLPLQLGALQLESAVYRWLDHEVPRQVAVEELTNNAELLRDPLLLSLLIGVIPVFEEVFFRGLLLAVLLRHGPLPLAVLLNGILFALAHDAGEVPVFLQGFALAYLYYRTRTLLAPLLFHSLHNGTVLLILMAGSS
jgi:membrane protease YdiL (CAAX protease family)